MVEFPVCGFYSFHWENGYDVGNLFFPMTDVVFIFAFTILKDSLIF